jgi:hypothetical protein
LEHRSATSANAPQWRSRTIAAWSDNRKKELHFCGSERGAQASAIHFSLIVSCHRHGIDAFAYLRDVLKELPKLGSKSSRTALLQLLPDGRGKRYS